MFKYYVKYILYKSNIPPMRTISEILWILFSGIGLFLLYILAAIPMITSIIGIIFVPKLLQIAAFSFNPIRYEIVYNTHFTSVHHDPKHVVTKIANLIWFIFVGWEFFIIHILFALVQFATIIGAGNGIRHLKIAKETMFPYGKHIRPAPYPVKPIKPGQVLSRPVYSTNLDAGYPIGLDETNRLTN